MSPHTPGPWYVDDEHEPSLAGVFIRVGGNPFNGDMGIPISSDAVTPHSAYGEIQRRADARLVAEAPAMYALLLKQAALRQRLTADNPIDPAEFRALDIERRNLLARIERETP